LSFDPQAPRPNADNRRNKRKITPRFIGPPFA
jgi:hypothetical protein